VTSSAPFGDIYPSLIYDDAPAAIAWLCRAFGFEQRLVIHGPHDRVEHSELTFGTVVVMVSSPKPETGRLSPRALGGVSHALSIYVDDPDAHCRRARLAGAVILRDVQDEEYGARGYLAKDPEGHLWYFGTYRPGADWTEDSPGEPAA
jgi:uncharacterized glyoxalase superfamily protein PhnB